MRRALVGVLRERWGTAARSHWLVPGHSGALLLAITGALPHGPWQTCTEAILLRNPDRGAEENGPNGMMKGSEAPDRCALVQLNLGKKGTEKEEAGIKMY